MPVMWKCYHCKKEIAPRAPTCPHCGGTFGVSQNGFMESNARIDEDYAREKAGLPPKSGLGCAIPFALLIGGLVTVSSLIATSDLFAAETKQSNVDIIGLRTGMTFQQFVNGLPKKFNKKFSNLRDSSITFRGNNSSSNTRVDFKGSGFSQVQDKHLTEHIAITLAPDFLEMLCVKSTAHPIGRENQQVSARLARCCLCLAKTKPKVGLRLNPTLVKKD